MAHTAPQGAWHEENWASLFLREKGHTVGSLEIWRGGGKRRLVDDRFMTNKEVISTAKEYVDWDARGRLFLEYLNGHKRSLAASS
jgi:hypothetical protein